MHPVYHHHFLQLQLKKKMDNVNKNEKCINFKK